MDPLMALATGAALGIAQAAHCLGMCGVFAMRAGSEGGLALTRYALGKMFTYVFLGVALGAMGAGAIATSQNARMAVNVAAGSLLLLAGIRKVMPSRWQASWPSLGWRPSQASSGIGASPLPGGAFSLGALTGALPCGASGLALLQATATGAPTSAGVFMVGFAIGTFPSALGAALGGAWITSRVPRSTLARAGGALLIAVGLAMMIRALWPAFAGTDSCCH